jgi:hypothetical protein
MANDPLPVAQRAPRIAALERELDELRRVEEVLVAAAIAGRPPRAPLAVGPAGGRARRQSCGEGLARRLMPSLSPPVRHARLDAHHGWCWVFKAIEAPGVRAA